MIAIYVSAATALVLAGAATGILVMVCLGIKRDDRPGGFPADANDRTARCPEDDRRRRPQTGAGRRGQLPLGHPAGLAGPWRFSPAGRA